METRQNIREDNDIDRLWPMHMLLEKISFSKRIEGRLINYLVTHGIDKLSLRQLMDLFLPPSNQPIRNIWSDVPILKQPQFGHYLFMYSLARLTTADLGQAFESEWAVRLLNYHFYRFGKASLLANHRAFE